MGGVDIKNIKGVFIGESVSFDTMYPQNIHITGCATITSGTKIITHYYNTKTRDFDIGHVTIGDRVFIGMNTLIVKPVKIENNSVIAAGSVVVRDIGENEIWGGNPAKFIKNR